MVSMAYLALHVHGQKTFHTYVGPIIIDIKSIISIKFAVVNHMIIY